MNPRARFDVPLRDPLLAVFIGPGQDRTRYLFGKRFAGNLIQRGSLRGGEPAFTGLGGPFDQPAFFDQPRFGVHCLGERGRRVRFSFWTCLRISFCLGFDSVQPQTALTSGFAVSVQPLCDIANDISCRGLVGSARLEICNLLCSSPIHHLLGTSWYALKHHSG